MGNEKDKHIILQRMQYQANRLADISGRLDGIISRVSHRQMETVDAQPSETETLSGVSIFSGSTIDKITAQLDVLDEFI